ncbi:MAG: zinc-binding dehydrogenase [Nitriliruptorales bacterium]|nr:zinc-binding dehydrogenase [Nitriliruptorales bacterium]
MRAVVNAPGTPDGVEFRDVPEPTPEPHEALIGVRSFSVNRGELTLLARRPDGWRPGQDLAGVVVRPAADGSGPGEGARVVAWADQAGWAQLAPLPSRRLARLQDHVSFQTAATLPVAGMTALRALRLGGALSGARVLVTGAAGGVGRFAVEMAHRQGAEVAALVRDPTRAAGLPEVGAREVLTDLDGVAEPFDLVLESVGGEVLNRALQLVARGGTVVSFGNSSRQESRVGFGQWGAPGSRLIQFFVYESGEPPTFEADLALLAQWTADGQLHAQIGLHDDWSAIKPALDALRDRRVNGKLALDVTAP